FVYGRGLEPAEAGEVRRMRERIAAQRGESGGQVVNIKTDRGGLIDVEFAVQLLQLRHGHAEPRIRRRATREALLALAEPGLLPGSAGQVLGTGSAFLRGLGGRLRIERDQPVQALDTDPEALLGVARRLGYGGDDERAVSALQTEHERHRTAIRAASDRVF